MFKLSTSCRDFSSREMEKALFPETSEDMALCWLWLRGDAESKQAFYTPPTPPTPS